MLTLMWCASEDARRVCPRPLMHRFTQTCKRTWLLGCCVCTANCTAMPHQRVPFTTLLLVRDSMRTAHTTAMPHQRGPFTLMLVCVQHAYCHMRRCVRPWSVPFTLMLVRDSVRAVCRHAQVRVIVERLARRCGYESVAAHMPPSEAKLLAHIRKAAARKERRRAGPRTGGASQVSEKRKNE